MAIHKYQAFVKVAEMGSITKAAEAMGYTQSAVSRMVADLEDEWNLNLLRRSRGGLALSSDGLMMLCRSRQTPSRVWRPALSASAHAQAFLRSVCHRY